MSDKDGLNEFLLARSSEANDVLDKQQINQAIMDVEDLHPMRRSAKMDMILPFLKPFSMCRKKPKPDFRHALRKTLLEEMEIKIPKSETQLIKEPFLMLGYGINAYFDLLLSLMYMFIVITIACTPIYIVYGQNSTQGMELILEGAPALKQFFGKYSLGNMGGATILCEKSRITTLGTSMNLTCPNSKIAQIRTLDPDNYHEGPMFHYGIIPDNSPLDNQCTQEEVGSDEDCVNNLNNEYFKEKLRDCNGQTYCEMNFTDTALWYDGEYDAEGPCGSQAKIFIQLPCETKIDIVQDRKVFGLIAGSIAVFIYLFTIVYFDYIKSVQKTKFVDFDVKTITAGDYSIEFDIDDEFFDNFAQNYYDRTNPIPEIAQFKLYVQLELEKRITEMPNLMFDGETEVNQKIAQITFAYENKEVINWLKTRGTYVKGEKWEKVAEINKKIFEGIQDEKLLNHMQRPCSVFASFETEEAYERATRYNDLVSKTSEKNVGKLTDDNLDNYTHYEKMLGQQIDLQEASEPTDIIWENRQFTTGERRVKRIIVYTIILIMLVCSGAIIYICSTTSRVLKEKYPVVSCESIAEEYDHGIDSQRWKDKAATEYNYNKWLESIGHATNYNGNMQCLCETIKSEKTNKEAQEFTLDIPVFETVTVNGARTQVDTDVTESTPICDTYFGDKSFSTNLGTGISFIIIGINLVLKNLIIALITWIGEDTVSEQLSSITNGVFYAQFLNTGIILLLVNANLTEHQPKFITKYMDKDYHDYQPEWYADVGHKIVNTMFINSILPYVGLVTGYLIPIIKRRLDNSCSGNRYKTKKTSMAQYKDLYSGAEYVIHFKYSGVLNIVFITCMYGMGMPILFALAAFNFFNQWVCERIIVAYQMRLPPALDDKLTNNCLSMIKFAPLLLIFNGYWMISSPQIFENKWQFIENTKQSMRSDHFIYFGVNWATPVMFMCAAAVTLFAIQKLFSEYLQKWGFAMTSKDIEVDEDLPNFFKCIRLSQADELIKEQENMKHNFGFIHNDPDTVATLDATKVPKKAVQGTPWYQILSNQRYSNLFYYVGAFIGEREKLIEDGFSEGKDDANSEWAKRIRCEQSDMIMILLNLSFIPDDIVHEKSVLDEFKSGWCFRLEQAMNSHKDDFNKQVESNQHLKYALMKKKDEEMDRSKLLYVEVDKKDDEKWASYEEIDAGKDELVFDTKWDYQNKHLEERYEKFKVSRDKFLLEEVPKNKQKVIE